MWNGWIYPFGSFILTSCFVYANSLLLIDSKIYWIFLKCSVKVHSAVVKRSDKKGEADMFVFMWINSCKTDQVNSRVLPVFIVVFTPAIAGRVTDYWGLVQDQQRLKSTPCWSSYCWTQSAKECGTVNTTELQQKLMSDSKGRRLSWYNSTMKYNIDPTIPATATLTALLFGVLCLNILDSPHEEVDELIFFKAWEI